MIKNICIPHFDTISAIAFIRSAYTVPTNADISAELDPGQNSITVRIYYKKAHYATFICERLREWRK